MALVNHNINNLSGGISRQPDEARFDNQVEEMVNVEPYVTGTARRRNPLELVSSLVDFSSTMSTHAYDRGDGLEKYIMLFDDDGLYVYDEQGNAKTVNIVGTTNPLAKWGVTNWKKNLKFLTVGDTTWLLNRNEIVDNTANTTIGYTDSTKQAFYWIKRSFDNGSGTGYAYQVVLDGVTYSNNSTNTLSAISNLAGAISGAGYTTEFHGSVLRISRATDFTFESGDSWGNQASVGWRNSIAKISDLPASMDGFSEADVGIIEITGTDRNEFTSYYLKWVEDKWVETIASDLIDELDAETLPAKIVRLSDGTFAFGFNEDLGLEGFETTWKSRTKGDDDSNPMVSFVGNRLTNMFFFRNRLALVSEENVVLSEVGGYYNFFATTVLEVLDGDPIDVSVDSDDVAIIRNVNAVSGSVTLWADNAQFVLSGGEILSPATTRIAKTSSYSCDNEIPPILVDNEIVFFNKIGEITEVLSYSASSLNTDKSSAEAISTNVVGYIPNTITKAVVASASNLVFLMDSADTSSLYVYKYHIKNNEKIMSAWFKWTFSVSIKDILVLDNILYVFADTNTLCKIELSIRDIDSSFLDLGATVYNSYVILSKFNIETRQGTRIIREPFYMKNVKPNVDGLCDLNIINYERNTTKTIASKHLGRKLFIGGNSDKVVFGFSSSYDTGFKINTISVEGLLKTRSKNY